MALDLDLIILVIASLLNITIGLLTYLQNPKDLTHKLFAVLTISLVGWTTANYFSLTLTNPESIFNSVQWILTFVVLQNVSFLLLASAFPENTLHLRRKILIPYLMFSAVVLTVSIYPGFFGTYEVKGDSIIPIASPLMGLFVLHTIISIFGGLVMLIRRRKRSEGRLKKQIKFLLVSSLVLFVVTPLTNFVLPNSLGVTAFVQLSPVYTLVFASIISYSMVQHKLFDFKVLVARSLAYLLSLGLVAGVISVLVYVLSESVRGTQISESVQSLIYVAVTLMLVLSYPALKRFFDRVTNSLFYRDAYDAEQFIGQLNKEVVSDIEIYSLLRKVVSVIENNLKVTYCAFATVSHQGQIVLVSDDPDERQDLAKLDMKLLKDVNEHNQIVVTDYLEDNADLKLKNHLSELDLGAVVCLVSKKSNEPEQFSKVYMVLGLKKSGNPYTSQDVRVLGIISNSLALAIQNALRFEEISRFNITLQEKIDEATRELKRTNEKLRALDEAKDEFISMASHQLRTPLTSVKGYVSMVLEGDTGAIKANQRKLLQQAFDSSQRMVYLIADLLNVSRLRTGKFVIENRQTNLADVVEGEVSQLKETAAGKQIMLSYEKPAKFPDMLLDETKIRQVIMNFLDNALYYTPSGGEVTVELNKSGDSVEYTVKDSGVGVPKKEQHHLFTKFYRAGNARKMRPDGTGLGLYMAQKVVVAQGGAIIFESEEGKGSTFGFKFPLKPKPARTPVIDKEA